MALCGFRVPFRICLYSKTWGKTTGVAWWRTWLSSCALRWSLHHPQLTFPRHFVASPPRSLSTSWGHQGSLAGQLQSTDSLGRMSPRQVERQGKFRIQGECKETFHLWDLTWASPLPEGQGWWHTPKTKQNKMKTKPKNSPAKSSKETQYPLIFKRHFKQEY